MRSVTIIVDEREKKPLPFPSTLEIACPHSLPVSQRLERISLTIKRATLPTADYLLGEDEIGCLYSNTPTLLVETKRSYSEIAANVLHPHKRRNFVALLERMALAPHAFLLIEGGLSTLYTRPSVNLTCGAEPPPVACVLDGLISLCLQYRVHPYILEGTGVAARQRFADFAARLLLLGGTPHVQPHHRPPVPLH